MKHEFALEPGGPKRLKITYPWNLANAEVLLDGVKLASFATKQEFKRGTTVKAPDGTILSIRFGPVAGMPLFKGVHVIRNGSPVPGSAADPVPTWTWPFMIACMLIPIISLGGAIPAVIGVGGVSGIVSVARRSQWSMAMRAAACSVLTFACWGAFVFMIVSIQSATGRASSGGAVNRIGTMFMSSSTETLLQQIEETYTKQGVRPERVKNIMEHYRYSCRSMEYKPCVDYLRTSLQEVRQGHYPD